MKRQEKKEWIDETLGSLDGLQRAPMPVDLYEKSMLRLKKSKAKIVQMSPRQTWSAAACLLVLVFANVFACIQYTRTQHAQRSGIDSFTNEYFAFAKPPQL